jgi:hypothetical protein
MGPDRQARTFFIDYNAKCPRCGKPGSVNGGLCLSCARVKLAAELSSRRKLARKETSKKEVQP